MSDELKHAYRRGVADFRSIAVTIAQKHMEPRLARQLVSQHPDLDGARGGFLLAAEHLHDDLLYAPDPEAGEGM